MSNVGYYRVKTLADSEKSITLYSNGVPIGSKYIQFIDSCTDGIRIKYLDKNGQYRFYAFNQYYETSLRPEKIGSINKLIDNIFNSQGNSQNIGYRNSKQISASADVKVDELVYIEDLYISPRVYMYIGASNSDLLSDWIEVEVDIINPVTRIRKGNTAQLDILIRLPEQFTTIV